MEMKIEGRKSAQRPALRLLGGGYEIWRQWNQKGSDSEPKRSEMELR